MKGSRSWKITKPLRDFTFILKKLKNRKSNPKKQKSNLNNQNKISVDKKKISLVQTVYKKF